MQIAIRSALIVLSVCVVALIALAIRIWTFDSRWVGSSPLDAAIVLGAAAHGGVPSPVFAGRLDFGETLLRSGAVRFIIVTGGGRDDPTNPESAAGVRYLVGKGLPPNRVLFETSSISTPENLCFAAAVGAAHGLRTYAIVSDPIHLARSMRYAEDLALDARPAATPYTRFVSLSSRIPFVLRETYVYAKRLLRGPVHCSRAPRRRNPAPSLITTPRGRTRAESARVGSSRRLSSRRSLRWLHTHRAR